MAFIESNLVKVKPAFRVVKGLLKGSKIDTNKASAGNRYLCFMKERFNYWLKRFGWLGFLFFLIKGLLWLIIPYLIARGILAK